MKPAAGEIAPRPSPSESDDLPHVTPHVSHLFVHPLKGARGIRLRRASLDSFGIRNDRRWLLVDEDGRFLSQRELPRLVRIGTALDGDRLTLSAPGQEPLVLDPPGTDAPRTRVLIWADRVTAADAGDFAADWARRALDVPCRLVHMPDDVVRAVHPDYALSRYDRVGFADAFPLLVISQAALDLLNAKLEQPIGIERFRPNIVIAGTAPHAEDDWQGFRVGDIEIALVKPCARCVVTTVDPATAVPGREPLRTLATYRRSGTHVLFGQNGIHSGAGDLAEGAVVEALSST